MLVLDQDGAITIVAHIDDDLLSCPPDIATAIAAGEGPACVFSTAGGAVRGDCTGRAAKGAPDQGRRCADGRG